jgi:hypothetical protein
MFSPPCECKYCPRQHNLCSTYFQILKILQLADIPWGDGDVADESFRGGRWDRHFCRDRIKQEARKMSKNIVNRDLPSRGHSAARCICQWVRIKNALADGGRGVQSNVIMHYRAL